MKLTCRCHSDPKMRAEILNYLDRMGYNIKCDLVCNIALSNANEFRNVWRYHRDNQKPSMTEEPTLKSPIEKAHKETEWSTKLYTQQRLSNMRQDE